jgi:membrane-associated phospholipid phosphatase
VDTVTRVFLAGMSVVTLASAGRLPAWPWLLAGNVLALALVELLARAPRASRFAGLVALWYPFLLVPTYYSQLGIIGLDGAHMHDLIVQRWETVLLGGQPSLTWHRSMPAPGLSIVLHACYLAHYGLVIGVPLWLWLRAGREACERAVFAITLAFFACFLVFAVFPVAGPYDALPRPTGPEMSVAPARLVHALLDSGSSYGTAFPSSHVAASWVAVLMGFKRARPLAIVLAPVALGLAAGTVYGQFHYAVDALAGAAVALACFVWADALRARLATRRS